MPTRRRSHRENVASRTWTGGAGYDDTPSAAWDAYTLTSFDQDVPALVDAALGFAGRMAQAGEAAVRLLVPPRLVMRARTR